nr:FAD-binding oxidoreductase [uncultured Holophaga sp.]
MSATLTPLIGLLGEAAVSTDPAVLGPLASDQSFRPPMPPAALIRVESAERVEALVKWAGETGTPLVPLSSGAPHHRGDTVPEMPGSVIVDLSGMKKVLNINRQHRMAVVEPGVTYAELSKALAAEGLALSMPLAPRATKSVVTSCMDLEPRLNALHQWNYTDPLRCMEVTWGDGNRMFTGEAGGGPRDLEKQWAAQKWQTSPTGPNMCDFYRFLTASQGTMGIVTWASLRCELLPQVERTWLVPAAEPGAVIEFAYQTLRVRFTDGLFLMNAGALACLLGESPEEIRSLRSELPPYLAVANVVGRELLPEDRVRAQEQDIAEIAQRCGLPCLPSVPGARAELVRERAFRPSRAPYWKETLKGGFQEIFFTTTLDRTPAFIEAMQKQAIAAGYPVEDIGIYLQPINMGVACHCEFILPYDPACPRESARMKQLFTEASETFAGMGAYYSRPHGIWARLQLNKDAQSTMTLRKIKGIFDPKGVMNPGKLTV